MKKVIFLSLLLILLLTGCTNKSRILTPASNITAPKTIETVTAKDIQIDNKKEATEKIDETINSIIVCKEYTHLYRWVVNLFLINKLKYIKRNTIHSVFLFL